MRTYAIIAVVIVLFALAILNIFWSQDREIDKLTLENNNQRVEKVVTEQGHRNDLFEQEQKNLFDVVKEGFKNDGECKDCIADGNYTIDF